MASREDPKHQDDKTVGPKPVLFDTDIGVDDAMALLFLHYADELDLVGITTTLGNASLEDTTQNALFVKDRFAIGAPVHRGSALTVSGKACSSFPAHIHGADGLGGIRPSPVSLKSVEEAEGAVDYLVRTVAERPGQVTIIAVGRLTNIALAVQKDPMFGKNVKELVVMGGALGLDGDGGNVTPVAEANMFGDPLAGDIVCRADIPMTMVGLDVTQKTLMSEDYFRTLKSECGDVGAFIYSISRVYTQFHRERSGVDGCFVHDSSAVAYALDASLFETASGSLRVVPDGMAIGQTIFSPDGRAWNKPDWDGIPAKKVCVKVDSQRFLERYHQVLASS